MLCRHENKISERKTRNNKFIIYLVQFTEFIEKKIYQLINEINSKQRFLNF